MEKIRNILQKRWVLLFVVAFGLAARLAVSSLGSNFDMRSWYIVAEITRHGGNVYAETSRYNYGPVWFLILHFLDLIAAHHAEVLRYLIAGFLSLADLGIFLLLLKQAGRVAAFLFFLNPISILITGYHGMFDNVAVLLGLWSARLLGDDFENPVNRRKICGLLVLGLSLMTKHVFFAFPFWLAVKQKGYWQKAIIVFVPVACFLLGFVPYWATGGNGIVSHVFHYVPTRMDLFYRAFVPRIVQDTWDSESLWWVLLILFAFICRTRKCFESLLIYTGVLVAFSPYTFNQYLAIPVVLAAVFSNPFYFIYTVMATIYLCGVIDGPDLLYPPQKQCVRFAIYALFYALIWSLWWPQLRRLLEMIGKETDFQLGRSDRP